ncbi:MAG: undecaprenyl/decaprenyl-phosphate alpha-N-acetylglucosaminyl 1-phosphate transferase, partial [Chlorobium limicola]|nr:undecaprenyl/decaprenyl-phosphate alpha-N-acetylglucosaminyl 1-phosphate transferase [Chlorobium limicola]
MLNPRFLLPMPVFAAASLHAQTGTGGIAAREALLLPFSKVPLLEYSGMYLLSLAVSFAAILLLTANAEKLGLIDMPDGVRKIHTVAKPLVGGLGMVAGILLSMLVFLP